MTSDVLLEDFELLSFIYVMRGLDGNTQVLPVYVPSSLLRQPLVQVFPGAINREPSSIGKLLVLMKKSNGKCDLWVVQSRLQM